VANVQVTSADVVTPDVVTIADVVTPDVVTIADIVTPYNNDCYIL
jgi:hypothetical protein